MEVNNTLITYAILQCTQTSWKNQKFWAIHKIRDTVFANFLPLPTPCDSAWQLAVHPIIEYVTLSQLSLPPLYSDTDFNALLNLSLNSLTPDQTPPYPHERHVFCEWLNGPFPQTT
jgi:hypothetical protein